MAGSERGIVMRTYRPSVMWAVGAFFVGGWAYFAWAVASSEEVVEGPRWWVTAALGVLTLGVVRLVYRLATTAVLVRAQGLSVRNVLRTVEVPWAEVEGFDTEFKPLQGRVGVAVLRSGRTLVISALQASNPFAARDYMGQLAAALDELERHLEAQRGGR